MLEMQSLELNAVEASLNASPPDFDFSMPCRYFKSSFARSLSLSNASKSLDYDINNYQRNCNNYNNNNSNNVAGQNDGPPLPQRLSRAGTPAATYCNGFVGNQNNHNNNKSSSIRSGQHTNHNNNNEVNTGLAKSPPPPAIPARRPLPATALHMPAHQKQQQQQQQHQQQHLPSLTQFRHAAAASNAATAASGTARGHINKVINHTPPPQQQQPQQQDPHQPPHNGNVGCNINGNGSNTFRRNVWPGDNVEQDCNYCVEAEHEVVTSNNTPDYETAAARTPTTGVEQHRTPFEVHESTMNVEAVILQNQVDTLQWQLKQVETSCEMYRAVMEEVARFLDRYHSQKQQRQLQQQQQQQQLQQQCRNGSTEQIARSKSLYHVYGAVEAAGGLGQEKANVSGDEKPAAAHLRARSSTNLIELKLTPARAETAVVAALEHDEQRYDTPYTAFKDFTWRRSPKKLKDAGRPHTPADDMEEKLNQEAFRLSRTIHNLLNTSTQQPDLTQHRNSLAAVSLGRLGKAPSSASIMTLHAPMHNSTSLSLTAANNSSSATSSTTPAAGATNAKNGGANVLAADMLFLRAANIRDSRLSLRSSTDSSVHSASSCAASSSASSSTSSKLETDEEHTHFLRTPPPPPLMGGGKQMPPPSLLCSTTEDESGFSSISSFQDVGVPLSSTLLSNHHAPMRGRQLGGLHPPSALQHADSNSEPHSMLEFNLDSRNSTLKAATVDSPATHPTNVVGVPLQANADMQQRWDSPSKTYRNAHKCQRFSTLSNEDAATVLWV